MESACVGVLSIIELDQVLHELIRNSGLLGGS